MADEENQGEGTESQEVDSASTQSDAQAEAAVSEKMNEIFSSNAQRDETNEQHEAGDISPDNPDGEEQTSSTDESVPVETNADAVEFPEATVEELKAAEKEAAAKGDYERATELRGMVKQREAEAPSAAQAKSPSATALTALARELGLGDDKDINDLVQQNPTLARITLTRIADGYNAMSLQYAQAARNGSAEPAQPASQPNATTQTAKLDALFQNLDKFAEIAGSEVVEQFIKPLQAEVIIPFKQMMQEANERRAADVRREIYAGYDAIAKDGWEKHYGKSDSLSNSQRSNRQQVAQAADIIKSGADRQNVPMTYGEAIKRAHLLVNAEKMKQQARTQLVSEVAKRSTQITSRPSNRVSRIAKNGDEAATAAVGKFWSSRNE